MTARRPERSHRSIPEDQPGGECCLVQDFDFNPGAIILGMPQKALSQSITREVYTNR